MYDSLASLIEDMPKNKIDSAYKKLKRKAFGWNIYTIVKDEMIKYEGDVLFSRANNTSQQLSFTYTFEKTDSIESSVSVSGDLSVSVSGKIKSITGSLNGKIRKEIGEKTRCTTVETTRTTLIIPPKTKLTVQIKGWARLNNGVARNHLFGVTIKKGTWEIIDVVTEYYDYYEESI